MSDHEKLREAIKKLRSLHQVYYVDGRPNLSPGAHFISEEHVKLLCDAAESTLPKTKMVEVWHLEWAAKLDGTVSPQISVHQSKPEAEKWKEAMLQGPPGYASCIRVTGPHQQEVQC